MTKSFNLQQKLNTRSLKAFLLLKILQEQQTLRHTADLDSPYITSQQQAGKVYIWRTMIIVVVTNESV